MTDQRISVNLSDMMSKKALRERADFLEEQIEARNLLAAQANRKDEAELARVYRELAGLLEQADQTAESTPPIAPEATPGTDVEPMNGSAGEAGVEPVGRDVVGVQGLFLALMHKYMGGTFDVPYAQRAVYPRDEKAVSYKKVYGTFNALKEASKAKGLPGKCCWEPLVPRDARPIRLPNGDVLLPDGTIREAAV